MSKKDKNSFILRPLRAEDRDEHGEMLFAAFNSWWWKHGLGRDFFACTPQDTRIYFDIYGDMSPGCSIAAFHKETGKLMGACFYHPRETHVSLGIMAVHPNYSGYGVAKAMVNYILDYTREHGYKACRLVNCVMNLDSFSLYNKAGFIPRDVYQDMLVTVPAEGITGSVTGLEQVRPAKIDDVEAMKNLELAVSSVCREKDYRYCIENPKGSFETLIYEEKDGSIGGFLISVKSPAINIMGPCVARDEQRAIALLRASTERFKGEVALTPVPMEKRMIVDQLYAWKAINVETHVKQVWGEFEPYRGVAIPSYLPETD
ncbi:MAG: GNAT family N-acetyltransferase [Spirochaetota bacterium]